MQGLKRLSGLWGLIALACVQSGHAAEPGDAAAAYAAIDRFVDGFARIEDDYVDPVDMHPLADAATAFIRTESEMNDAAWGACMASQPPARPSKKKKAAALASLMEPPLNALECIGFRSLPKAQADRIVDQAIRAMLAKLDDRSGLMTLDDLRGSQSASIGLMLSRSNGEIIIQSTLPDTPSRRALLKPGDILQAIDGESTTTLSLDQVISRLRGAVGSTLTLTIGRKDQPDSTVTLARETLQPASSEAMEVGQHLILKIHSFSAFLTNKIAERLASHDLASKTILIDLRDSPGGLFDEAVGVADLFLDKGVIVTQKGRTSRDVEQYRAKPGQAAPTAKIVVFVNGGTASGAEILAAALRDNKRAVIVGAPTAGLGTVQTAIPISTNHFLKLTTSRVYLPGGEPLAGPLTPDCPADITEFDLTIAAPALIEAADACPAHALLN